MNHQLSAATSTAAAPTISSACPTYSFCSPRSTGCHSRKAPKWDSRKALDSAVSMPKMRAACSAEQHQREPVLLAQRQQEAQGA